MTEPNSEFTKETVNFLEQEIDATRPPFPSYRLDYSTVVRLKSREREINDRLVLVHTSGREDPNYIAVKQRKRLGH